jgi:hypothetical protein
MKHLLLVFYALLFILSSCSGSITYVPQSPTMKPPEESSELFQTEDQITFEPTESVAVQSTPDSTQEIISEVAKERYQLQSYGLLPEFVEDLELGGNPTYYEIEVNVTFDPSHVRASIDGMARITYTHSSDIPLNELVLMLWPNDEQYNAEMVAGPVRIDGRLVESSLDLDGLALHVPLLDEITLGEKLEVSLPFKIETEGSIRDQRVRFGITNGVLIAPTFYPLIPPLIDGEWQVEIPPEGGDTTNSDVALYQVTITAPVEMDLITSGVGVDRALSDDKQQTVEYVTGPMRDFAFAVGSLEKISDVVNDVTLNVWVLPQHYSSGEKLLDAAIMQMGLLHDLVGPYPYPELDILDTPCAFGGIEYPGLLYICSLDAGFYIDTTVHEIAHQWFYGLIGNDQLHEPWLDESAATYWQVLYYENAVGEGRAASQLHQYETWVYGAENQDAPIGLGIDEYASSAEYYTIVYYKGALFYDALREHMGDELFFQFLREYYNRYQYQFVHTSDFQATAEDVCACDLSTFFDLWVSQGGEILDW